MVRPVTDEGLLRKVIGPERGIPMFGSLGAQEILLLIVLGVLLFGKRLPEIGRSLGKTVIEFKKGIAGIEDQIHTGQDATRPAIEPEPVRPPQRIPSSAPRFDDAPSGLPPQV